MIDFAEKTPPKLPTPRSTSGPSVRSIAPVILRTARLPSSMSTPGGRVRRERRARRSPPDVAAHLHAVEADRCHPLVRRGTRRGEIVAQPGDGQHPPARDAPVGHPGREHDRRGVLDRVRGRGSRRPRSEPPGIRRRRRRRCRRRRLAPRSDAAASSPRVHASSSSATSDSTRGSTACASGSPNRQLNSISRGPSAVSINPAYSTPTYGVPAAARWSRTGCTNVATSSSAVVRHGGRRVGTHPAGVRSGVALADALVVLGDRQWRARSVPSHSTSSEHSGPWRRSSSTNGPCAAVVRIASIVSSASAGTITPLPAANPSSLTTTGRSIERNHSIAGSAESNRR